jgi:hypothetical protein
MKEIKQSSNFGIFSKPVWSIILDYAPGIVLNKAFAQLAAEKAQMKLNSFKDTYLARIQEYLLTAGDIRTFKYSVDKYGFFSHRSFKIIYVKHRHLFKKLFEHAACKNFAESFLRRVLIKLSCNENDPNIFEQYFADYTDEDTGYCAEYSIRFDNLREYYLEKIKMSLMIQGDTFFRNLVKTDNLDFVLQFQNAVKQTEIFYITGYTFDPLRIRDLVKVFPQSDENLTHHMAGMCRAGWIDYVEIMLAKPEYEFPKNYEKYYLNAGLGGNKELVKLLAPFVKKIENYTEKYSKYIEFYKEPMFSPDNAKSYLAAIYTAKFLNKYFGN